MKITCQTIHHHALAATHWCCGRYVCDTCLQEKRGAVGDVDAFPIDGGNEDMPVTSGTSLLDMIRAGAVLQLGNRISTLPGASPTVKRHHEKLEILATNHALAIAQTFPLTEDGLRMAIEWSLGWKG